MSKTVTLPDGLGKSYTYMNWDKITNTTSNQYIFREAAKKNNDITYDSRGYAMVNGRYVIALTSTFGTVGDYVDIKMADGSTLNGVIGDIKSQNKTWNDQNPANKWGHNDGQSVVEFITNWSNGHDNPVGNGGVVSITNIGNYMSDNVRFTDAAEIVEGIDKENTEQLVNAISGKSLGEKILYYTVLIVILGFISVVGVWFFLKAFDIKAPGIKGVK